MSDSDRLDFPIGGSLRMWILRELGPRSPAACHAAGYVRDGNADFVVRIPGLRSSPRVLYEPDPLCLRPFIRKVGGIVRIAKR